MGRLTIPTNKEVETNTEPMIVEARVRICIPYNYEYHLSFI